MTKKKKKVRYGLFFMDGNIRSNVYPRSYSSRALALKAIPSVLRSGYEAKKLK